MNKFTEDRTVVQHFTVVVEVPDPPDGYVVVQKLSEYDGSHSERGYQGEYIYLAVKVGTKLPYFSHLSEDAVERASRTLLEANVDCYIWHGESWLRPE